MPAMMLRPAASTAGWSSWSRRGSVAAMAGTITWSRSSGSVPDGSAACAARPTTTAADVARHGPRPAAGGEAWAGLTEGRSPVHRSWATSSNGRLTASRVASRPRKRRVSPEISVMADSSVISAAPAGRRGRPRRTSRSTSSGSNRLPRPSPALARLSTPRLT